MVYSLTLTPEHGWLLLSLVLIAAECITIGFSVVGKARTKVFTKQWMETHFGKQHQEQIGAPVSHFGYPDMGNGRYTEKLPYNDWLYFNNAQRAHYNLIEQITTAFILLLVGGIAYPLYAAFCGFTFFIARILYCFYVSKEGAKNKLRGIGAILGDIALLGGLMLAVLSGFEIINSK